MSRAGSRAGAGSFGMGRMGTVTSAAGGAQAMSRAGSRTGSINVNVNRRASLIKGLKARLQKAQF